MQHKGVEIGQSHRDDHHPQQSSHAHGVCTDLGKDINKKRYKQTYNRPQHERGEGPRDIGVIQEIVEKPKVKDARYDIGTYSFLRRLHFHRLNKP